MAKFNSVGYNVYRPQAEANAFRGRSRQFAPLSALHPQREFSQSFGLASNEFLR
jgi:hypothetical protein